MRRPALLLMTFAAPLVALAAVGATFLPVAASAGSALRFDGVDDYAWVPNSPTLDITGPFTIEAWVKPEALPPGWNPRVVQKLPDQYYLYYHRQEEPPPYGLMGGFTGPTGNQDATGGGELALGAWSHVAVSATNNSIDLYLNSVHTASADAVGPPLSMTGEVRVGTFGAWYDYFKGMIDELRIWNVARSQADILTTMYTQLSGNEPGLVAYWRFDEGEGQSAADSSGHGNAATLGASTGEDASDPAWVISDAPVPLPAPQVLLELHPNERGAGWHTGQYLGIDAWKRRTTSPHSGYWWQDYQFAGSGMLWIQVCAQNWDKAQTGYADDDNTYLFINAAYPADYDGIQTGPPAGWQWRGDLEHGQRWTLRFLVIGPPGPQVLRVGCDESPVVWWVKVTDLEPGYIEP